MLHLFIKTCKWYLYNISSTIQNYYVRFSQNIPYIFSNSVAKFEAKDIKNEKVIEKTKSVLGFEPVSGFGSSLYFGVCI